MRLGNQCEQKEDITKYQVDELNVHRQLFN